VVSARDDVLLLDDVALDPADEQRAIVGELLHFRCRSRARQCLLIVVPEFRNPIDLDIGFRNVRPRTRPHDVRLHIAPHTRHRMREWPMNLQPVLDELLVRQLRSARQQSNNLDHAA
jgi:hypothetical protein